MCGCRPKLFVLVLGMRREQWAGAAAAAVPAAANSHQQHAQPVWETECLLLALLLLGVHASACGVQVPELGAGGVLLEEMTVCGAGSHIRVWLWNSGTVCIIWTRFMSSDAHGEHSSAARLVGCC